ncbi:hypothetical protein TNCV_2578881 [Trichonephila clavipes]|nr:hypothetical protein TNCV_2578881 [Trichonephila clavipes]
MIIQPLSRRFTSGDEISDSGGETSPPFNHILPIDVGCRVVKNNETRLGTFAILFVGGSNLASMLFVVSAVVSAQFYLMPDPVRVVLYTSVGVVATARWSRRFPVDVVWKLRRARKICRPRHLTMVQNYKV